MFINFHSVTTVHRFHKCATIFLIVLLLLSNNLYSADSKFSFSKIHSPKNGGIYVVAHRGVHENIPENSLPAYKKAIELGCDFIEIDVRTTQDGHFVSIHNATIDAYVLKQTGTVKEMTLAELKALDIGIKTGPQWKGTQIPTFEDILILCKGKIGIYLDLKDAPVKNLLKIIKKHKMEKEIIWYAHPKQLKTVQNECHNCLPMPEPYFKLMLPNILKTFQPKVIASSFKRLSPELIKSCHEAGAIVIADETTTDDWEKWINLGLDGIQTDHPEKLIHFLKNRSN